MGGQRLGTSSRQQAEGWAEVRDASRLIFLDNTFHQVSVPLPPGCMSTFQLPLLALWAAEASQLAVGVGDKKACARCCCGLSGYTHGCCSQAAAAQPGAAVEDGRTCVPPLEDVRNPHSCLVPSSSRMTCPEVKDENLQNPIIGEDSVTVTLCMQKWLRAASAGAKGESPE